MKHTNLIESMALAHRKKNAFNEQWTRLIIEALGFKENQEFFYQYVIDDKYIVDFAFPDKKIIVEADGKEHRWKETWTKDKDRDSYLTLQGWKIIRLTTEQIKKNPSFCKSLIKLMYYET